jgi:uncharacterized protein YkwD
MITKLFLCASMLMLADGQATQQKPPPKTGQKTERSADHAVQTQPQSPMPPEMLEKEVDGVKLAAIEANVVKYTNEERVRYGLPPLVVDKELMETAREQAAWMTRSHSMTHTRRPLAENIAMGQPHSSDAVGAWMNSSGHRANILNPGHRRIGVAAFRTESGTIYWCQQFRG